MGARHPYRHSFIEVSSNPLLRLDSLAVGVFVAVVQRYLPDLRALADRRRSWLAVGGAGGLLLLMTEKAQLEADWTLSQSFFARVPLLTLLSISIGLLIVACDRSRRPNGPFSQSRVARLVRLDSVSSYAAHLLHSLTLRLSSSSTGRIEEGQDRASPGGSLGEHRGRLRSLPPLDRGSGAATTRPVDAGPAALSGPTASPGDGAYRAAASESRSR